MQVPKPEAFYDFKAWARPLLDSADHLVISTRPDHPPALVVEHWNPEQIPQAWDRPCVFGTPTLLTGEITNVRVRADSMSAVTETNTWGKALPMPGEKIDGALEDLTENPEAPQEGLFIRTDADWHGPTLFYKPPPTSIRIGSIAGNIRKIN